MLNLTEISFDPTEYTKAALLITEAHAMSLTWENGEVIVEPSGFVVLNLPTYEFSLCFNPNIVAMQVLWVNTDTGEEYFEALEGRHLYELEEVTLPWE